MATSAQERFFAAPMYAVDVRGWPADQVQPPEPLEDPVASPPGARLRLWQLDPRDARHVPEPDGAPLLVDTG